jgi:frataxin-like iron-binding protein CyaY
LVSELLTLWYFLIFNSHLESISIFIQSQTKQEWLSSKTQGHRVDHKEKYEIKHTRSLIQILILLENQLLQIHVAIANVELELA